MPKFLEDKLKREYPGNPHAVFGTLNKIGAMHGNKITAKGERMEAKHTRDVKAGKASVMSHPHPLRNLKHYAHPKRGR